MIYAVKVTNQIMEDYFGVPNGYELKEKKEHKIKRLENELAECNGTIKFYEGRIVELSKEATKLESELAEIKKDV